MSLIWMSHVILYERVISPTWLRLVTCTRHSYEWVKLFYMNVWFLPHGCVISHVHVTHTNESCYLIWICYFSDMNTSCHMYMSLIRMSHVNLNECVISLTWMRLVTLTCHSYEWFKLFYMNVWLIRMSQVFLYECVISPTWMQMRLVTRTRRSYKPVMLFTWMGYVTDMNAACPINTWKRHISSTFSAYEWLLSLIWVMSHAWMHTSHICPTQERVSAHEHITDANESRGIHMSLIRMSHVSRANAHVPYMTHTRLCLRTCTRHVTDANEPSGIPMSLIWASHVKQVYYTSLIWIIHIRQSGQIQRCCSYFCADTTLFWSWCQTGVYTHHLYERVMSHRAGRYRGAVDIFALPRSWGAQDCRKRCVQYSSCECSTHLRTHIHTCAHKHTTHAHTYSLFHTRTHISTRWQLK